MIAVMPNAGRSWYVDSKKFGGPGDYETAISDDLVSEIDARYPTTAEPSDRGIAGYSMGGHGALRLAFRHPDTFMSVVALAPAIWKPGGVSERNSPMNLLSPDQREAWFPNTTGQSFDPEIQKHQSPFASLSDLSEMSNPPRNSSERIVRAWAERPRLP